MCNISSMAFNAVILALAAAYDMDDPYEDPGGF